MKFLSNTTITRIILFLIFMISIFFVSFLISNFAHSDKDTQFVINLGSPLSLNKELELISDTYQWDISNHDSIILTVKNKSESETIRLHNTLAELQVFRFDNQFNKWEQVYYTFYALTDEVILNPNNSGENENQHTIEVNSKYINILDNDDALRFLVIGYDITDGDKVGAFIDIEIIHD